MGNRNWDKDGGWCLPPATLPCARGSLCISAQFFSSLMYLVCLSIYPSTHPPIHLSSCLSVYLSVYVSIHPSIHLPAYLSICLYHLTVCALSRVQLFVVPWTVACQTPLSMGFPRQEYWSGLPFLPSGDLPNPGLLHWRQIIWHSAAWEALIIYPLIIYIVILSSRKLLSK